MYHINSYYQSIRSLKMGTLRGTWMKIRRNNQWMSTSGVEWYCMILQSVGCYDMLSYDWQVKRSCQRTVKHKETVQRSFLKNTHLHPPTSTYRGGGKQLLSDCGWHGQGKWVSREYSSHGILSYLAWSNAFEASRKHVAQKYHYIDRKGKGYPCV